MTNRNFCAIITACVALLITTVAPVLANPAPCFPGDVNDDGAVDMLDVGPFTDVLLGINTNPAALCAADVNGDTFTDGGDIQTFTEYAICGCGCGDQSHCNLGEVCIGGFCQPTAGPDLEIGLGGFVIPGVCTPATYGKLMSGGDLIICEGFQGSVEIHLTLRATGFTPGAPVNISYRLNFLNPAACTPGTCPTGEFCDNGFCTIGQFDFVGLTLTDLGGGVLEYQNLSDVMNTSAAALTGQNAVLTVTVTDQANPAITATQEVCVNMLVKLFCFGPGTCPPGFDCVNFYCEPIP